MFEECPIFNKLAGNEVVTVKRKIFKSSMTAALSVIMLIGCVLVLVGCGKKPANELDGTKWIATYIVDSDGMPYTSDIEYEMKFSSETVTFSPGPDIYGYVSGAGETYHYSLENGKLSIQRSLGDVPTVERYNNKVIEIRTSSGVLFRYEPET